MLRAVLVLAILAGLAVPATAGPRRVTPAQAKAANAKAFRKALAQRKLATITLAATPADPIDATGDGHYVATVIDKPPTFAVDGDKRVYRIVRKIKTVGRVPVRVCRAGPQRPIRVARTRFDVPRGHTFAGDVEVRYDAFVLDEKNTCRRRSR